MRLGYERLAAVISDPRLTAVAKGRVLSEATLAVLRRVSDLAATRLREAKS